MFFPLHSVNSGFNAGLRGLNDVYFAMYTLIYIIGGSDAASVITHVMLDSGW